MRDVVARVEDLDGVEERGQVCDFGLGENGGFEGVGEDQVRVRDERAVDGWDGCVDVEAAVVAHYRVEDCSSSSSATCAFALEYVAQSGGSNE